MSYILIRLSLEQAQAKAEGLRPLNIAVPANPQNATEKWLPKMAALIPSPKHFPVLKNDTKSEPGKECCTYRVFRFARLAWMLRGYFWIRFEEL